MYKIVEALEQDLGRAVDLVLQVGDFGIWPSEARVDEATRRHGGAGDFPRWLAENRRAPRPTVFIPGNHEDFDFLVDAGSGEILPDLHFLPWAEVVEVAGLRIGGLGGCYSAKSFRMKSLSGRRRRHYSHSEIDRLTAQGRLDILMIHDAPAGRFSDTRPDWPRAWTTATEGLLELIEATRPRVCLHGHLHGRFQRQHQGVPIQGLTAVPWAGSAIAFELGAQNDFQIEAEWTATPTWRSTDDASTEVTPPVDLRPLIDILEEWRDAILEGDPLDRAARKVVYPSLPTHRQARRILMAALSGSDLVALFEDWTDEAELQQIIESRPDPTRVRALLDA